MRQMIRTYSELQRLKSFDERYEYLRLKGNVGESTFGYDRYLNQMLYKSKRWLKVRDEIIIRDLACDLGIVGYEIHDYIVIHHMNPISIKDIELNDNKIYEPNFLICTTHRTHMAIHYGDKSLLFRSVVIRHPGDTIPWL